MDECCDLICMHFSAFQDSASHWIPDQQPDAIWMLMETENLMCRWRPVTAHTIKTLATSKIKICMSHWAKMFLCYILYTTTNIIIVFMYTSLRTPVLAAVCQILILPSNGLKRHIIHLLSCLAPSFTQVSQTPMCKGNAFPMTPGSQQTSVHAPSRMPQGIPSTSSRLTRHWVVKRTTLRQ